MTASASRSVYIGSFTPPQGEGVGITRVEQDVESGRLTSRGVVAETDSPGFLAWHPDGRKLYAVNGHAAAVQAFTVEPDGGLTDLGRRPSGGDESCHVAVAPSGRFVTVANYSAGNLSVFRLAADGSIGERTALVHHDGPFGPNPDRQKQAHVHQTKFDASGKWLLVNDLGTDRVYVYRLDPETGSLSAGATPSAATAPGAGPRHLVSLSHGYVYTADELDSTISAFTFDDGTGTLTLVGATPSTKNPVAGENYPSEIAVSANGRFVYVANRGANVIGTHSIDGPRVEAVADTPTGGDWPRHLAVIGGYLYVANERSHTVTTFRLDPGTGVPEPVGEPLEVPSPGCILAAPQSLH
jgi:6-phosphogluconolactonase (cycloisomerase 2 family)